MERIPFNEKELTPKSTRTWRGRTMVVYDTPISDDENLFMAYRGETPLWLPGAMAGVSFTPRIIPDNIARGFAFDGEPPLTAEQSGGPDMFGTEWVFVPEVGGSMVKPGNPRIDDANDWRKVIQFPDIETWDWEGSRKANEAFVAGKSLRYTFLTGYFERLISFMDFEGAAMALIDEDQQDAVHDLFDSLTKLYLSIFEKLLKYFPEIKIICLHDDWGSQRAPFFSLNTLREMIIPYLKRVSDWCHERGIWFDLHSCGHNEFNVPGMIEAGVDSWSGQPMNDKRMLYKKYGKEMLFSIDYPAIANDPDATKEELEAAAKEYVDFCCADPSTPVLAGMDRGLNPYFSECVYKFSRIAYNS